MSVLRAPRPQLPDVSSSRTVSVEFVRYLIAGATAFVVDVAIFLFLVRFVGIQPVAAAIAGYLVGLILVYVLSVRWVFSFRRLNARHLEFASFVLIGGIGLAINVAVIAALTEVRGMDLLVSKLIATGTTFTFNFALRKLMLFSRWQQR